MLKKLALNIFFVVAALELFSQLFDWPLIHWICKPLLVILLVVYYYQERPAVMGVFVAALGCCWLGDVFLLLDRFHNLFFTAGLGAFLIAHVLLIFSYRRMLLTDDGLRGTQRIRLAFPVILAGSGLVVILYPRLGDLRIPVAVYATMLTLMVLQSIFRLGRTNERSFWMVFIGAVLFMVSDALLAVNKFYQPLTYSGLWVMATYTAALFLIVEGVLAHRATARN